MPDWAVEKLDRRRHDAGPFDCGKPSLDDWLRRSAGQHGAKGLAVTYVLVRPSQARIFGYYAISTCAVCYDALPQDQARGLPRRQVLPAVLLGRLAVDRSIRGQGLGDALLADAFERVANLAGEIGMLGILVHALDDEAASFYRHKGFLPMLDDPHHFFLPLSVVRKLIAPP